MIVSKEQTRQLRSFFPIARGVRVPRENLAFLSIAVAALLSLASAAGMAQDSLLLPAEKHFARLRQLTFGGENAEGYFSFNESHLIFQSTRDTFRCDQMYTMDLQTGATRLVSTGLGRTTCGYYFPGDTTILFASTHASGHGCPPPPDYSKGYVWAVYPAYDIYRARADGSGITVLTSSPGYDAEATVSPTGNSIVFTSSRNGDLDLFAMNPDGSNVRQLTHELGYDGGAFYSWDGSMIVYRACHYADSAEANAYRDLLARHLVRPSRMELFVMNPDGSGKRQITNNGAANFAPFFHPDNKRIIFASNMADPHGRNFDLYIIGIDGSGLERITFNETFDGFPMFTRDGKRLVFASNRNGRIRGETNLFIADWKD
jgi:Tol biopolymer transport system component